MAYENPSAQWVILTKPTSNILIFFIEFLFPIKWILYPSVRIKNIFVNALYTHFEKRPKKQLTPIKSIEYEQVNNEIAYMDQLS